MTSGKESHISIELNVSAEDALFLENLQKELLASNRNIIGVNFSNNFIFTGVNRSSGTVKAFDLINEYDFYDFNELIGERSFNSIPSKEFGFEDYDFEIAIGHIYTSTILGGKKPPEEAIGRIIPRYLPGVEEPYYVKIVAILYTDVIDFNTQFIYMQPEVAHHLLSKNTYDKVEIMLKRPLKINASKKDVEKIISKYYDDFSISSWTENNEFIENLVYVEQVSIFIIQVLIALAIAFSVGNLLNLIMKDHHKEIGILKTMGLSDLKVASLFLVMALVYTFVSLVLGILLAKGFNLWFMKTFTVNTIPLIKMKTAFFNKYAILTFVIIFIANIIGSFSSIIKVKKLKIIEAINEE